MKRLLFALVLVTCFVFAATTIAAATSWTTSTLPAGTTMSQDGFTLTFNVTDPHGVKYVDVTLNGGMSKRAKLAFPHIRYDDPETGEYWYEDDLTRATATVTYAQVEDRNVYAVAVKVTDSLYKYTNPPLSGGSFAVKVPPKITSIPHSVYGPALTVRFPFTAWDNSRSMAMQGRVFNFGATPWTSYGGPYGSPVATGGGIPPADGLVAFTGLVAGASENGVEGYPVDGSTLNPGIADLVRKYNVKIQLRDNYPTTAGIPVHVVQSTYPLYVGDASLVGADCADCHTASTPASHLDHCGACHGDSGPVGWMGADFPEYAEPVHDPSTIQNCAGCHLGDYDDGLPVCPVCGE